MTEPNDRQRRLVEGTEGVYLVDAGAGTGKTFALTRRYANVVEQTGVEPEDVLVVTFTRNAATEMKERIVGNCEYGMRELADAPIGTFHALCRDILEERGHAAPEYLGIDDSITASTRVLEDELREAALFEEFLEQFSEDNPEYDDRFRALSDPTDLLDLLGKLAAKGVFPTADGWYRDGERHLDGDLEAFEDLVASRNEPRNAGSKQSELRSELAGYGRENCYLPDAPDRSEVRGDGKRVPPEVLREAFEADREGLKWFVRDVYHGYLEFCLRRNYLNFGFLQLFAYVLLCEDDDARGAVAFEYVMIDEFQDTSELQFELALLLSGTENLCVVGDWKQSIYGFQYADVDNVLEFETRLARFAERLNRDRRRVPRGLETPDVTTVEFVRNYRSTQAVLEFAEHGLCAPATSGESVDEGEIRDRIVSLESTADREDTTIEALRSEDEPGAVVAKLQAVVGSEDYLVPDGDGGFRPPEYGDVAVLTRTRGFGRELLATAAEYGVPMAYEGGIEAFRTDEAKLLLAWLRILEADLDRGWAVVLERAGYVPDEMEFILERGAYPDGMTAFRAELAAMDTLGGVARRVFERYGLDGPTADVVLETVESVHAETTMTRGDVIRYLERGIETGSTREIEASAGENAATVQTIHAAKGLEYPIVVLANMNQGRFPPSGGSDGTVTFEDPVGLRQRKRYDAEAADLPFVYDDWRTDVLRRCLPREYDEERRLLYVAITRAEHHVVCTAGERPNGFLEALPVDVESVDADPENAAAETTEQAPLTIDVPTPSGPIGHTPHTLMRDDVFEGVDGRGTEYGTRVHEFAEAYALGEDVEPSDADERAVAAFLDDLDGDSRVEVAATLPLSVDGERVTVSGVVDLLHVTPDRVDVVDYKTDRGRHAHGEYETQLSVYYHVVADRYPDREVTASVFYTADAERVRVDPLSEAALEDVVRSVEFGTAAAPETD